MKNTAKYHCKLLGWCCLDYTILYYYIPINTYKVPFTVDIENKTLDVLCKAPSYFIWYIYIYFYKSRSICAVFFRYPWGNNEIDGEAPLVGRCKNQGHLLRSLVFTSSSETSNTVKPSVVIKPIYQSYRFMHEAK